MVQIDEAQIGRRKYNRGRWTPETWVLGMIDEDENIRVMICERRDMGTLEPPIIDHVAPGSRIHTDGWPAYRDLDCLSYYHRVVNHKKEFVAADGSHTQKIERVWRDMRHQKFSAGGIRRHDIAEHLIEYMWRRECLKKNWDPFARLVTMLKIE